MGLCTGFSFLSGFEVFYHCFFGCVDAGSASKKGGGGGDKVGDFPQKTKAKIPVQIKIFQDPRDFKRKKWSWRKKAEDKQQHKNRTDKSVNSNEHNVEIHTLA